MSGIIKDSEGDSGTATERDKAALIAALARTAEALPSGLRAAFILRYVVGAPVEEVPRRMAIPISDVQQLCVKALAACRIQMDAWL